MSEYNDEDLQDVVKIQSLYRKNVSVKETMRRRDLKVGRGLIKNEVIVVQEEVEDDAMFETITLPEVSVPISVIKKAARTTVPCKFMSVDYCRGIAIKELGSEWIAKQEVINCCRRYV